MGNTACCTSVRREQFAAGAPVVVRVGEPADRLRSPSMLDGLDAIDWEKLTHAYGSAADVPDMIRALRSPNREVREAAEHAAYGNIFHQGTRYSATPHAIPFLIELIADPGTPDRAGLLALCLHCVAGYFGPTFGPATASGAIWGAAVSPMEGYGETLELLAACERAAECGVPVATKLLSDRDADVRAHAAFFLAALWAHADEYEVVSRVRARLSEEPEAQVRAMLTFALGHLLPPDDDGELHRIFAEDTETVVRVVAAMGCVRRGSASAEMARALVGWLADDDAARAYARLPFGSDDLAGTIGAVLPELGSAVLAEAMPSLLERLRTGHDFGLVGVLAAALAGAFGEGPYEPGAQLTPVQRELCETLAHNQAFWSIGNAFEHLRAYGLPTMRDEMAGVLGIVVVHDEREAARNNARVYAAFGAQRAMQAWLEMLEKFPDDAEALATAGLYHLQVDDDEAALELFDRAIAVGPDGAEHYGVALYGRGTVLLRSGQLAEGDAALAAAMPHLRGDKADAVRQNRIAALQRLGRADEALAIRRERRPQTTDDWYHLGLAEVKAGHYHDCIESIGVVLERVPDHGLAHYTVACAHALLGESDAALESIARAIDSDPELAASIAEDEDFASLRGDPRLLALVRQPKSTA